MGLEISTQEARTQIVAADQILLQCQRAKEFEEAGEFNTARDCLRPWWPQIGERPLTNGLPDATKVELLLRAGTLTGWLGSAKQVHGAQEMAKDLITESAVLAQQLGLTEKFAEANIDLGICYWREGALDEARVTIRQALESLADLECEQKLRGLLNSAIVEQVANRYEEALRIFRSSAPLFEKSTNGSLIGKFHNSYALCLKNLGLAKESEELIDNALVEFAAARFHFEQVGHKRFLARVENNEGFLFASLGKFKEAHQHLNRARALQLSIGDQGGAAGVDDTRAQTFLLEGRNQEAEKVARAAVVVLRRGGEQAMLAEALTTQAKALARLNQTQVARETLDQAIQIAHSAGDPDSGGIAALTVIEELSSNIPAEQLVDYYRRAEELLVRSQHPRIRMRLGECARRVLARDGVLARRTPAGSAPKEPATLDPMEQISLEAEVLQYEANLIRKALESSGGSVTRAARLLGVTHQGLAFIINGRHRDLLSIRTPVKRRRKSIIRYR